MSDGCDHHWYWRRRRSNDFGYWECVVCTAKTTYVGLDSSGRALSGPEDVALRDPAPVTNTVTPEPSEPNG